MTKRAALFELLVEARQPDDAMVGSQERSFIDETLDYHASGGDLDAVYFLTGEGSDDDRSSDARIIHDGWTRLFYAAREGWCSVIVFLLEQGADVNLGWPSKGLTPLHSASWRGRCDAAVLLLDAGARVDDRSRTGRTALHVAAANNRFKMCKLLLSRGASLDALSTKGRDPEALARNCVNTTVADFLAAVRAAGGWAAYVAARRADRAELLDFRRALPTLRRFGPCAERAQARLFLDAKVPDDVFVLVLQFWRSDRDF
jgi:ankyrin repeat protein